MKNIFFLISILIVSFLLNTDNQAFAQKKVGHVNSAALLNDFPATKASEKKLETLTKQLEKEYEAKLEAFKGEYTKFQKTAEAGNLTGKQIADKQQSFVDKEKELRQFEMDAQKKVLKKREELLSPILNKVEKAIKEVGKENGYGYIFDSSLGAVLYAQDADDVMPLVKAKLGI